MCLIVSYNKVIGVFKKYSYLSDSSVLLRGAVLHSFSLHEGAATSYSSYCWWILGCSGLGLLEMMSLWPAYFHMSAAVTELLGHTGFLCLPLKVTADQFSSSTSSVGDFLSFHIFSHVYTFVFCILTILSNVNKVSGCSVGCAWVTRTHNIWFFF